MTPFRLVLAASALALFGTLTTSAQQPYQVLDHWKIGGAGGWDYLLADPSAHLLYITHGPRVEILDTKTGKSVGAITGVKGTHGIALDADGKFGYISDGGGNSVLVFDRSDFHSIATIPTGTNPDGILFEPVTKTVWAFNGRSNDASVIDTATNKVVATIKLPGKPEFPVADGTGTVFVNIETANSISKLDAKTLKLIGTWKLSDCESPSGLAIDTAGRKLFAVCDGKKMAVVDADTGKQIATPAIGDGPDAAGFSPRLNLAFASAGDGTLTVVDTAHDYKILQDLPTAKRARTMAYDAEADRVYTVTSLPDGFNVIVIGRNPDNRNVQ